MIFEGSEKKFECTSYNLNFRELDSDFYETLVSKANATILKKLSNDVCDAYLLSESSLFVWTNRILMITCGNTTLKDSLLFLIEEVGVAEVDSLIYQRKNEHFSDLQISNFEQDVVLINSKLNGSILKLGADNDHHNLIFSLNKKLTAIENDHTFEVFCYDISKDASEFLTKENLKAGDIREFLRLDQILKGFEISDFVFEPCGYSLNALNGDKYCTIHVTPQEKFSYVSFETNMSLKKNSIIQHFIQTLNPESLDIVSFNINEELEIDKDYAERNHHENILECGYHVDFQHLYKRNL